MLRFAALIIRHEKISTNLLLFFLFNSQCSIGYRTLVCANVGKFSSGYSGMLSVFIHQ